MRRLVALVIALMLVGTMLVGCGGGGDQATTEEAAPAAAPPAVAPEPVAPTLPKGSVEGPIFEPFPSKSADGEQVAPDAVQERLDDNQPMVVFFYDSTQKTSDDQSELIKDVLNDYRGLIDFVKFDVSKYVTSTEDGEITVVPNKLKEGSEGEDLVAVQVAKLISGDYLGVKFTPYTILVDHQGYMTYRIRGVMDDMTFEREILRATQ